MTGPELAEVIIRLAERGEGALLRRLSSAAADAALLAEVYEDVTVLRATRPVAAAARAQRAADMRAQIREMLSPDEPERLARNVVRRLTTPTLADELRSDT